MTTNPKPDRRTTATNTLMLVVASLIVLALLVRGSDNAYIGLGLIGLALMACAVLFLVATALPSGMFRRVAFFFGIFLVWAFGLLSTVYLVYTVAVVRSMNYGSWVLTSHLLALPLVVLATYLAGVRSLRPSRKRITQK